MKNSMLIGIDPDVYKSGVAFINEKTITLKNLTFFELFDFLSFYKEKINKPIVYIECGFLNKSNWHKKAGKSAAFNQKLVNIQVQTLKLLKK
jgi:hypothetical protein